ncbi:MAG TPA: sigma-70 family RNA polymerase sigma factor [Candidatus Angelobacter sp.]|nr:sigma-70 family RNA polymerase sigma factor [Candidatus Angelobacter sp.]
MQITQANMAALAEREVRPGLEQAFLEHKDRVFRAAYRITGNAGDAEDVLQTVFLRLVRQENLSEVSNLAAYLHRSAVNASLDLLRRRRDARTSSLDDQENPIEVVSANTAGPSTEIRDWLRQALGRLNPRWAEMFVLRFIEDYSNGEIAGMMNTSPAVVAVLLHRTRAQLKRDFKKQARGRR